MEPYLPDAERLALFRDALPAAAAGIYLDTLTAGPLPAETARALEEADAWDLRTGRAGVDRQADTRQRMEEARGVLAALIGGDPDDIVLTSGVREAITIASQLARSIELVELVDPVGGGVRSSEEIAALAARSATPVVVDAGNAVGALAVDVRSFGATFVAFSGQRWLLGPEGTGALWIDRGRMQRAPAGPQMPDADPLPRRSILGLARSVGWLEMYIGLPWIHERMGRLATGLHADLAAVDGVNVLTPAGTTSGILSLDIAGWPAELAADELGSRAFAILGAPPAPEVLRVSFGAFNTEDELNRFVGVVALCAEHTPETMPRRPGLVVLS